MLLSLKHNPPGWGTCLLCQYTRRLNGTCCAAEVESSHWLVRLLIAALFAPRGDVQ